MDIFTNLSFLLGDMEEEKLQDLNAEEGKKLMKC